ncbi:MAG: diguanylate cyclase [Planctomycetota bacterium]
MINNVFEERILMGRLPSSQQVARRLVELARRDSHRSGLTSGSPNSAGASPSNAEIAAAIQVDPALTGRLLERANLLREDSSTPLESVAAAIDRLGSRELLIAVNDLTLITAEPSRRCAGFDYETYWSHSLARAVAAERIAEATGRCSPESAYTLGLLSDIGRLALASVYPKEYTMLLAGEGGRDPVALARLEREHLEIDHAAVTACLLEHWGLRKSFFRASRLFQDERTLGETEDAETLHLVKILRCARLLGEECVEDATLNGATRIHRVSAALRSLLEFSAEDARLICADVSRRFRAASKVEVVQPAAKPERNGAAEDDGNASPRETRRGLRILAVDDDPTSLFLLRRVLREEGHEVLCASDGAEALRLALENNLQAVVADWMMPRMDGLELCQALRCIQSGRELFFLLLTGRDTEDQIVAAYDAGVDEYVTKPFNPRILLARLRAGQRIIELKKEVDGERLVVQEQVRELGLLNRRLRSAALTDPLTGLPNRRFIWDRLTEEWQSSESVHSPLTAMMVDIDAFKRINDLHGHEVGDIVLKQVGEILRSNARKGEDVARIGGEEFLVLCPNTTLSQAAIGAERLRAAVEAHVVKSPAYTGGVTVSLGVAERTEEMSGIDALLKAADDAVYAAKSAGRNQVKFADRRRGEALSA